MTTTDTDNRMTTTDHTPTGEPAVVDAGVTRRVYRMLSASFLAGLVLVVLRNTIVDVAASILPGRAQISGRGTNVERFEVLAPSIVYRTGLVLMASAALALVARSRNVRAGVGAVTNWRGAGPVLVAITGLWYGWLGSPHNGFSSNSRYHWVDWTGWDDDLNTYAAGKLPHELFYETPFVWNGLVAALTCGLTILVCHQIGFSRGTALLAATFVSVSGNVLLFWSTGEDVMLNLALLLIVVLAHSVRRPVWLGLALALLMLGRPSFFLVVAAVIGAEILVGLRRERSVRGIEWRFTTITGATWVGATFVAQTFFTLTGDRYLFTNGSVLYSRNLATQVAVEVEGFTLYAFSGVFIGHFLWFFPAILLVASAIAVVRASRLTRRAEVVVYALALSAIGIVALYEAAPQLYYNVRYISYTMPLLVVLAWSNLAPAEHPTAVPPTADQRVLRSFAIALLVLAPMVTPSRPLDQRRALEARPEIELLDLKSELRELSGDRRVYLDFGSNASRNYVSYVIRADQNQVALLGDRVDVAGVIISRRDDPWSSPATAVFATDTFVVHDTATAEPD